MRKFLCGLACLLLASAATAQQTDVGIEKNSGVSSIAPGAVLVYTLTVTNHDLTDVVRDFTVEDTVPLQTTFLPDQSLTGWVCTDPAAGGICRFQVDDALAPGGQFSISFAVQLDLSAAGALVNTATVTPNEHADVNPGNNSSTDTTPVGAPSRPDLFVEKIPDVENAAPGDVIVFQIDYGNSGNQSSTGVVLRESVPLGSTFEPSASAAGWSCSGGGVAGQDCALVVGSVAGGGLGGGTVAFAVRVNEPVPAGTEAIDNTVFVEDDGTGGVDLDPDDNTSMASVALDGVVAPDLALSAAAERDPVGAGELLTYNFLLSNFGSQDASGVELAATLPLHTTFEAGGSSAFVCPTGAGGEVCLLAVGGLTGNGGASAAALQVRVVSPLPSGVSTLAMSGSLGDDGTGGVDPDLSNNTASVVVGIDSTTTVPDLVLTGSADVASVNAGGQIVYTFSGQNVGSQNASGSELVVQLPLDAAFVAAGSSAFSCASSSCTLSLGTLPGGGAPVGAALVLSVANSVSSGVTAIDIEASLNDDGAGGSDPNPADNMVTLSVPLEGGSGGADPDLTLGVTSNVSTVNAGEEIRFTFDFANVGSQGASGIELSVPLPLHTSLNAADSSPFACSSTCVLSVGELAGGGANGSAVLVVSVDNPLGAGVMSIDLSATIDDDGASGPDQNPADNQVMVSVEIGSGTGGTAPDLTIQKSDSGIEVDAGGIITYTITYANNGPQDASGVLVLETVPANTTFHSAGSPGFLCGDVGQAGDVCAFDAMTVTGSGGSGTATFSVRVDGSLPADVVSIENTVWIEDDGASGDDQNPLNNVATEATPIASTTAADMAITKSDGGAVAVLGGDLQYTLTVENLGTREAVNVEVTEALPAFTSFDAAASDGGWSCAGTLCSLSLGNLDPGESRDVFFGVRVASSIPGGVTEILNGAAVSHDGADLDSSNDLAETMTPLDTTLLPDLGITIEDGDVTVDAGDDVVYTLDWMNSGPRDVVGAMLSVLYPDAAMSFDAGGSSGGWSCSSSACTFDLGAVDAGVSGSLTLAFTIANPLGAGIEAVDLQATIGDSGLAGPDANPLDNTDSVTTEIGTGGGTGTAPDLWVVKSVQQTIVARGGIARFELGAGNAGNQDEAAALLLEQVPENTTFSAGESSKGWVCKSPAAGSDCYFDLGSSAAGTVEEDVVFSVVVGEELRRGLPNVARIAGTGGDQNVRDNQSLARFSVGWVDLAVRSEGLPERVVAGQPFTYRIPVESNGSVAPTGGVLEVRVGADVLMDDRANAAEGWRCQPVAETIFECSLPLIAAPTVASLHLIAGEVIGNRIGLSASVRDDGAWGPDPTRGNNGFRFFTEIVAPSGVDLMVEASDGGVVIGPRSIYAYDVAVRNSGRSPAGDAFLLFQVPQHTVFNEDTGGWECFPHRRPPSNCIRELGAVAAGGTVEASLPLVVDRVLPDDLSEIVLELEVLHDQVDDDPSNNVTSVSTDVIP